MVCLFLPLQAFYDQYLFNLVNKYEKYTELDYSIKQLSG